MLKRIEPRNSTTRETYDRLREAILAGTITPGSRLFERRLAEQLGVSRTPVREALKMLEAEELVVSVDGGGAAVREVTPEEVDQTYEIRALLEGHAARLAAERVTPAEITALRALNRRMRQVLARERGDTAKLVHELAELNADFHRAIVSASGNLILARVLTTLMQTPLYARAYFWFSPQRREASVDEHERMIELLESRDAAGAAALWSNHLRHGRDRILEGLEQSAPEKLVVRDGGTA